jgi:aquaporin Z
MAPKLLVEFIGTFFLVIVVGLSGGNPLAIGGILAAMIFMWSHVSGGNFNPAVSIGLSVRGAQPWRQTLAYIGVQLVGGITAAAVFFAIVGHTMLVSPGEGSSFGVALLVEVIFTFALVSAVLNVATTKATANNQYFGLAIGLVFMASIFAGGAISGGAFNPAIGLGPVLFDVSTISSHGTELALYSLGPVLGGVLAALAYRFLQKNKK